MGRFMAKNSDAEKSTRQLFYVPSGYGKSRIIAAVALLATQLQNRIKRVIIVFANESMLQREEKMYASFGELLNKHVALDIMTAASLKVALAAQNEEEDKVKCGVDTLTILDEADNVIFDHLLKFPKNGKGLVVGFTATLFKKEGGVEQKYLDHFGFKTFQGPFKVKLKSENVADSSLTDFMSNRPEMYAKLVYCKDKDVEKVKDEATACGIQIVQVNCRQHDLLAGMVAGSVFIVTELELMRGYDYRCNYIDLFLMRKFPTDRDMKQGLGRVGRHTDFHRRFKLPGLILVSDKKENAFIRTVQDAMANLV